MSPEEIKRWWGPPGVECIGAEIDLCVGGRYRIGNRLADGTMLWIVGEFEVIDRPRKLAYTWQLESQTGVAPERVVVSFEPSGAGTEVVVVHERIPDAPTRASHEQGWIGCLAGLAKHL